ncbi:Pkinase-fungal domain-containing protein [Mycena indigotica]|uniref:Pkinase-fungal domain-containing protein n=1 Tax=Mycena indigotica TaxID=2126181 RepID=A0A8H6SIQ1_9AGAR|nr:Pkinase-fungal domain-containing protein [Mycena indigotica]KAF7299366.1 Pkinase-fungal domain-containing protein [Mycena indigotica]
MSRSGTNPNQASQASSAHSPPAGGRPTTGSGSGGNNRAATPEPVTNYAQAASYSPAQQRDKVPSQQTAVRSQATKDDPDSIRDWTDMLIAGYGGVLPIADFFEECMGYSATATLPTQISRIFDQSTEVIATTKEKLRSIPSLKRNRGGRRDENDMLPSLIKLFEAFVQNFPPSKRPKFFDLHNRFIRPHLPGEHGSRPDVGIMDPNCSLEPEEWVWNLIKAIVEFKLQLDFIDENGQLKTDGQSMDAATQLAKSARSLLMTSGSTHVFVASVFQHKFARIFRFDHGGFKASEKFDWVANPRPFIELLLRLFRPNSGLSGPLSNRIDGDDDTARPATKRDLGELWKALQGHTFYKDLLDEPTFEKYCRKYIAARRKPNDPDAPTELVTCLQIGPPLSVSDGLFSRATHVYRVAILEDLPELTIYALKDAWKQGCRRDEIDFYDLIEDYIRQLNEEEKFEEDDDRTKKMKAAGMAKCHGMLNLSQSFKGPQPPWVWKPELHKTCTQPLQSRGEEEEALDISLYERYHTRALLTPVGRPLNKFPSTKALCTAIQTAGMHHQVAYNAGVLHRDISEGNILFDETTMDDPLPRAFLVDWDYAEFVNEGIALFEAKFPDRMPINKTALKESLKRFTGTLPFMALDILRNAGNPGFGHKHYHDLESLFWVQMWMLFRYTEHCPPDTYKAHGGPSSYFFGSGDGLRKRSLLYETVPLDGTGTENEVPNNLPLKSGNALYDLCEALREEIIKQNPILLPKPVPHTGRKARSVAPPLTAERTFLSHPLIEDIFDEYFQPDKIWPANDRALKFFKETVKSGGAGAAADRRTAGSAADRLTSLGSASAGLTHSHNLRSRDEPSKDMGRVLRSGSKNK